MTGSPRAKGLEPSDPEESALWRALRERSSSEVREALFSRHAAFARQVAARHFRDRAGGDLDLLELRQLAYAGLLEAIDRFDADRGVPFRGYAARRIAGSVLDGIAHASERREQIALHARLRAERLRSLADEEVEALSTAEAMQALAEIAAGLAIGFMLDTGLAAARDTVDRHPSAYDSLAFKQAVRGLMEALERLPERERLIVRQHYLEGVSFDLIAGILGVSKGRISQMHKAAIGRLRSQLTDSHFTLRR